MSVFNAGKWANIDTAQSATKVIAMAVPVIVAAFIVAGGGAGPGAVGSLATEEVGGNFAVDVFPVLATELPGGLGAVVDGVEVIAGGLDDGGAEKKIAAGLYFRGVGMAQECQGEDARAGEGGGRRWRSHFDN